MYCIRLFLQTAVISDDDITDESPVVKRTKRKLKLIAEDPFLSDDDDFQGTWFIVMTFDYRKDVEV